MDGPPINPATIEPPIGVDRETFTLAYLAAHESECPACGYNLHALTIARCPECGRPLEVRLIAQQSFSRLWVAMLVVTALGAGVGMLLAPEVVRRGLPHGADSWLNFFLIEIPLLVLILHQRRRYSHLPRATQWMIALPILIVTGGMLFWLGKLMMGR